MNLEQAVNSYYAAVYDVSRERANHIVENLLEQNIPPEKIVFEVISPSLDRLIDDFMHKKVILSQHFVATKISDEIMDRLMPMFQKSEEKNIRVVIGCSKGDFHGLGKKVVIGSLKANMIKTVDLGLNVSAEKFVDEALKIDAHVIGISSMMVHTAIGEDGPKKVRTILEEKNLDHKIKLIVGGAPYKFDEKLYLEAKADDFAGNGLEAVKKIVNLYKSLSNGN